MLKYIINFFIATILFLIFIFFKMIGKNFSSNMCSFIFRKVGAISKYDKIAKKNILYVWPKKKPTEIKRITNAMWQNIGRNFGELVHLKNYKPFACTKTKIIGINKIKSIISKNRRKKKRNYFFLCSLRKLGIGAHCY